MDVVPVFLDQFCGEFVHCAKKTSSTQFHAVCCEVCREVVATRPNGANLENCSFTNQQVPGEVGPGEVGPVEVGPGEVGPGEVGPGEVGPGEVGPGEVGPGEAGPGEVGPVPTLLSVDPIAVLVQ